MVPPPSFAHEDIKTHLLAALLPVVEQLGLIICPAGLFQTDKNYRVPDLTIGHHDHISQRGWEGATLVIEILSPNDESRDKLPFFSRVGVREAWLVEPETREIEIYRLTRKRHVRQAPPLRSVVLGCEIEVKRSKLILRWPQHTLAI